MLFLPHVFWQLENYCGTSNLKVGWGGGGRGSFRDGRHRNRRQKKAYSMLHNRRLWFACLDTVLIAGRVELYLTWVQRNVESLHTEQQFFGRICYEVPDGRIHAWLQASAAVQIRSSLYWDVTRRWLIDSYRRFGISCQSHLRGSSSSRTRHQPKNLQQDITRSFKASNYFNITYCVTYVIIPACSKRISKMYHTKCKVEILVI
jgi:hypothetical protein